MSSSSAPEVQALFARIAPVYDDFNFWLSLGLHRVWKKMTVSWSGAQPGQRALDVCCGTGDLTQLLAEKVGSRPPAQVIGVDFCPQLLAIAAQRIRQRPSLGHIQWQVGDALALPFPDNSFDCATMGYGLRNVKDISQALAELRRVLKVGSKVAILDFHRPRQTLGRQFQSWYLENVVVPWAEHFQMRDEYKYIQPSVDRFPSGTEQVKLAQSVGFSQVVHYEIAGGMMGVLVAQK